MVAILKNAPKANNKIPNENIKIADKSYKLYFLHKDFEACTFSVFAKNDFILEILKYTTCNANKGTRYPKP